jgi:hypothetical protein
VRSQPKSLSKPQHTNHKNKNKIETRRSWARRSTSSSHLSAPSRSAPPAWRRSTAPRCARRGRRLPSRCSGRGRSRRLVRVSQPCGVDGRVGRWTDGWLAACGRGRVKPQLSRNPVGSPTAHYVIDAESIHSHPSTRDRPLRNAPRRGRLRAHREALHGADDGLQIPAVDVCRG